MLVDDKYKISINDGKNPKVAITPDDREKFPWTHFNGVSVEDALLRAITKLHNPETDYRDPPNILDPQGYLWKADERSVYSEDHTRVFLRVCDER